MSDRFKFRVYDTALKSYRTDMYIGADGNLFYFHDGRMDKVTGDRWIVERCTSLKDLNNEVVYEGDEVYSWYDRESYTVGWRSSDRTLSARNKHGWFDSVFDHDFVLIGNIHDGIQKTPEERQTKMNQGDHIRSMSNDDLVSLFITLGCCPDSVSRHACTYDEYEDEDCRTCWAKFLQKKHNGKRTVFNRLASSVDDMAAAMVHASWGIVDGEQEVIGYTSRFDPEIHDTEDQAIKAAIQLLLEDEE